jgi:hypothetical protein
MRLVGILGLSLLRVLALAALVYFLLRGLVPAPADAILAIVAGLAASIAYGMGVAAWRRRHERTLVAAAIAGNLPRDGQRVAVVGRIRPAAQPLTAPLSGERCVAYSYEAFHTEGSGKSRRRVQDFTGMALCPSRIHSTLGPIRLLGFPHLDGFPEEHHDTQEACARMEDHLRSAQFEASGLVGSIAALETALIDNDGSLRHDWRLSSAESVAGLALFETGVPVDAEVCAIGMYSAEKRGLVPDRVGSGRSLRLVRGSAAQVIGQLACQRRLFGAGSGLLAGLVIALLAGLTLAPEELPARLPGGQALVGWRREQLLAAVRDSDAARVARLLRAGVAADALDERDRTPLMHATDARVARLLLDAGAAVEAREAQGQSPLILAASGGQLAVVELLLARGADVHYVEPTWRRTALDAALDAGHPEVADVLARSGARDPRSY